MSEFSRYLESFELLAFDPDVTRCKCRGNGWALSELDTWHKCRYHYKGQPHPEDDGVPYCPECMDGENYPPDQCPRCGPAIREQLAQEWHDMPEPPPPPDFTDDPEPDDEIPF